MTDMTDWNTGQQMGIEAAGENTLVSASAGTGKTAVLVERLIRRLAAPVSPLDMDRFIFVTFTNAAAQSMIRKVRKGIEDRADKEPHNRQLAKQRQLLGQAAISTLHGFCLDLIRKHYKDLGIDPDGRVLSETEQTLLQGEVLESFLEDCYRENNTGFAAMTAIFGGERSDEPLKKLILRVYSFAAAQPQPYAWLEDSVRIYRESIACGSTQDRERLISLLKGFSEENLRSISGELERGVALAGNLKALEKYEDCLLTDGEKIRDLSRIDDWDSFVGRMAESGKLFGRLPTILAKQAKDEGSEVFALRQIIQPKVKAIRERCKKNFQGIVSSLLGETVQQIGEEMTLMAPAMLALASVAAGFYRRYEEAKQGEAVLDFDDIEHYALRLLLDSEGSPTALALALREHYREILVDEYQDINPIQEAILQALRGESFYMVGDVKQSIYGFRQAAPRLFLEKFHRYGARIGEKGVCAEGNGDNDSGNNNRGSGDDDVSSNDSGELVKLEDSYRGSQWIVEGINQVFDYSMTAASGGIDYRREGRFACGIPLPEEGRPQSERTQGLGALELYVIDLADVTPAETNTGNDSNVGINVKPGTNVETDASANGRVGDRGAKTSASMADDEETDAHSYEDANAENFSDGFTNAEDDAYALPEPGSLEAEAVFCASRIERLMDEGLWDRDKGERRPVQFKDIAILLQSMKKAADVFVQALRARGIPAYAETGSGYFRAQEVQTALSFLKTLDNPRQDIPLAALMLSPAIGFTPEELGRIKVAYKAALQTKHKGEGGDVLRVPGTEASLGRSGKWGNLYKALVYGAAREKKLGLSGLKDFLRTLKEYRIFARQASIADVLARFYEDTGFLTMSAAMPGGVQRRANLLALLQRAREFEETRLQGLYQYIQYLEAIESRGEDLAPAPIIGEGENVVRIMSIHKSKGLEFPVVMLAMAGRQFNNRDAHEDILLHETHGMASRVVHTGYRVKYASIYHKLAASRIIRESTAERLRVLYVALTRAEQRLIVVAAYKKGRERYQAWLDEAYQPGESVKEAHQAACFMDWLGPAILGFRGESQWVSRLLSVEEVWREAIGVPETKRDEKELWQGIQSGSGLPDETRRWALIGEQLAWRYPWDGASGAVAKLSVTQARGRLYPEEDPEAADAVWKRRERQSLDDGQRSRIDGLEGPRFLQKDRTLTPGERGTLLHRVLARVQPEEAKPHMDTLIDQGVGEREAAELYIESLLSRLIDREFLTTAEAAWVDRDLLAPFLLSNLFKRMAAAAADKQCRQETSFTMAVPASRIYGEADRDMWERSGSDDQVIIQGTIDVFFAERDKLVLVDYKSDRIKPGQEDELMRRYQGQLLLYAEGLEAFAGRQVDEMMLYSMVLGKEIHVKR